MIAINVEIDLDKVFDSLEEDDKNNFILYHINYSNTFEIINKLGGINTIIEYIQMKTLSTTEKVRLRHLLKDI